MAQETSPGPSAQTPVTRGMISSDHKPLWSLKRWFGKEEASSLSSLQEDTAEPEHGLQWHGAACRSSRKVVPGLPRPGTFKRQMSELRVNLEPTSHADERRTVSVDRRRSAQSREASRPGVSSDPRVSAPVILGTLQPVKTAPPSPQIMMADEATDTKDAVEILEKPIELAISCEDADSVSADEFDDALLAELEKCWILNLSMHFRDRSNREKFFVTYAEKVNRWRRVTVSLDYRDAPRDSLEDELQHMQFQRDKSARIYESIRESLPDIQFYETVTNLKLQTEQDRLHVHVTEDIHEVIKYPEVSAINHLHCRRICENAIIFDSHLSGFVYKVLVNGHACIKKEIPGPDTVEEFLYEINALHRLAGSKSVIRFEGVIVDNDGKYLKGLLISYAEKGALIDVLFDFKGQLSWARRERWAKQIVHGLSEIHEGNTQAMYYLYRYLTMDPAGFVQGDFTLSNIVIDANDNAKIIDINRRGCPVGWEPPEIAELIESRQRISMYIGVKSDLFQLGMVLWAVAMQQDEPELHTRPLTLEASPDKIPHYYQAIVENLLSKNPSDRSHASALLKMFPNTIDDYVAEETKVFETDYLKKDHLGPTNTVDSDDMENSRVLSSRSSDIAGHTRAVATDSYVNGSTDLSEEPYDYPARGRSPPVPEMHHGPIAAHADRIHHEFPTDQYTYNGQSNLEPFIVSVTPPSHLKNGSSERKAVEQKNASSVTETPEQKPRTTEAAPGSIIGDLTGVGEHSTILNMDFPSSLDHELMSDMT